MPAIITSKQNITLHGRVQTEAQKRAEAERFILRDTVQQYRAAGLPVPQSVIDRCKAAGIGVEE